MTRYFGGKKEGTPEAEEWRKSAWDVDSIDERIDPDITMAAMARILPMAVGDAITVPMQTEPKELTRCLSNKLKLRKRNGGGAYELKTLEAGVRIRRIA